jgi:hypothetical protein
MKRDATTDVIGKSAMNRALWRILPLVELAYALFEIPSNLMLVRFGTRKWIARIMTILGAIVCRNDVRARSFQPALITLPLVAVAMAGLILLLHRHVRGRAARPVEASVY